MAFIGRAFDLHAVETGLPTANVPVRSVPMKFPRTLLPIEPLTILTPAISFSRDDVARAGYCPPPYHVCLKPPLCIHHYWNCLGQSCP